jgi:uncharacterized protein YjgD (DUF1641 family)
MAEPLMLEISPRDPRAELVDRLQNAPVEHAEALLEGYEVIQGLHDAGILNLMRGLLLSGDQVMEDLVETANKPGSLRAIRNLIVIANVLESIDPDVLKKVAGSIPQIIDAIYNAHRVDPPGFLDSIKLAQGANVRRGLSAIDGALSAVRNSVVETKQEETKNAKQ